MLQHIMALKISTLKTMMLREKHFKNYFKLFRVGTVALIFLNFYLMGFPESVFAGSEIPGKKYNSDQTVYDVDMQLKNDVISIISFVKTNIENSYVEYIQNKILTDETFEWSKIQFAPYYINNKNTLFNNMPTEISTFFNEYFTYSSNASELNKMAFQVRPVNVISGASSVSNTLGLSAATLNSIKTHCETSNTQCDILEPITISSLRNTILRAGSFSNANENLSTPTKFEDYDIRGDFNVAEALSLYFKAPKNIPPFPVMDFSPTTGNVASSQMIVPKSTQLLFLANKLTVDSNSNGLTQVMSSFKYSGTHPHYEELDDRFINITGSDPQFRSAFTALDTIKLNTPFLMEHAPQYYDPVFTDAGDTLVINQGNWDVHMAGKWDFDELHVTNITMDKDRTITTIENMHVNNLYVEDHLTVEKSDTSYQSLNLGGNLMHIQMLNCAGARNIARSIFNYPAIQNALDSAEEAGAQAAKNIVGTTTSSNTNLSSKKPNKNIQTNQNAIKTEGTLQGNNSTLGENDPKMAIPKYFKNTMVKDEQQSGQRGGSLNHLDMLKTNVPELLKPEVTAELNLLRTTFQNLSTQISVNSSEMDLIENAYVEGLIKLKQGNFINPKQNASNNNSVALQKPTAKNNLQTNNKNNDELNLNELLKFLELPATPKPQQQNKNNLENNNKNKIDQTKIDQIEGGTTVDSTPSWIKNNFINYNNEDIKSCQITKKFNLIGNDKQKWNFVLIKCQRSYVCMATNPLDKTLKIYRKSVQKPEQCSLNIIVQ